MTLDERTVSASVSRKCYLANVGETFLDDISFEFQHFQMILFGLRCLRLKANKDGFCPLSILLEVLF